MRRKCGHKVLPLTPNGRAIRAYIRRATEKSLRVEQVNDIIAMVEIHMDTVPKETPCERCLDSE